MNDSKPDSGRQAHGRLRLGSYAGALEPHFLREMAEIAASGSARGLRVLVPSREVRDHLRRRLAEADVPTFDLRFQLLPEFAETLLAAADTRRGFPGPEWDLLNPRSLRVLLAGVVRRWCVAGPATGLRAVADQGGFLDALLGTITDLEEASVSATALASRSGGVDDLTHEAGGPGDAVALAELYARWEAALAERRLETRPRRMARAALAAAALEDTRLVIYGFYDWSGVQERLLSAAATGRHVTVYVPGLAGAGQNYSQPLLERFAELGLVREDLAEPATPPRRPTFVSAAGERREAEEAVRALLGRLVDNPLPLDRVAFLYRAAEPYSEAILEALQRSGLPAWPFDPPRLGQTPAGRTARLLLEAAQSDRSRRRVLDVLDVALPLRTAVDPGAAALRLADWDALTREANVVAGSSGWEGALPAYGRRLRARLRALDRVDAKDAEGSSEDAPTRPASRGRIVAELESLEALEREITPLLAALDALNAATDWGTLADTLVAELGRWLGPGPERDQVVAAVLELGGIGATGEAVDGSLAARALGDALDTHAAPGFQSDASGVFVGGVMAARGLTFDIVYLLGVNDRVFPRQASPDPLLRDAERMRLTAAGYRLPLFRRQREEEAALFELTLGSAPEVSLFWSRVEPATGKPRLPSPALMALAGAGEGRRVSAGELEAAARRTPLDRATAAREAGRREPGRPVAFAPAEALRGDEALDTREFERLFVSAAVGAGAGERLAGLAGRDPAFRRALDAEVARWRSPVLSAWDGRLVDPAALAALAARFPEGGAWSPTTLEGYARCPFHFFVETLLDAEPLEEPEALTRIDPLDRGQLLHAVLCEFLEPSGTLGRIRADPDAERGRLEHLAARHLAEFEAEGRVGRPLLWRLDRERLVRDLLEWFDYERRRPLALETTRREWRFGMPATGDQPDDPTSRLEPLRIEDASGRAVAFRGRIDRVDVDPGGRRLRVVDYKSGRKPNSARTSGFIRGESLQLPVYLLAAAEGAAGAEGEAEYLYLSGGTAADTLEPGSLDELRGQLAKRALVLVDGIRAGLFFGAAGESGCAPCRLAGVCGPGQDRRFARKQGDPLLAAWQGLKGGTA